MCFFTRFFLFNNFQSNDYRKVLGKISLGCRFWLATLVSFWRMHCCKINTSSITNSYFQTTKRWSNTNFFLLFPRLHGIFVLLKFVTPIRIHLMIVDRFAWRWTPVGFHCYVIDTQQRSGEPTFVQAGIAFWNTDDDDTTFAGADVFIDPEKNCKFKNKRISNI